MHACPCLCATTRLASRAITRVYEAELRGAGLLAAQFWLLSTLSQQDKINQSSLTASLAMDQTTLSRNLSVLVRNGWVKGAISGRQRIYSLTPSGRATLTHAQPYWKRAQDKMQLALGRDWDTVLQAMTRLAGAADGAMDEPQA